MNEIAFSINHSNIICNEIRFIILLQAQVRYGSTVKFHHGYDFTI